LDGIWSGGCRIFRELAPNPLKRLFPGKKNSWIWLARIWISVRPTLILLRSDLRTFPLFAAGQESTAIESEGD
jgi:hypothetical protein